MLDNLDNIKQKQEFLAYRVKKNREQKQREAMEAIRANGEQQQQSALVSGDVQKNVLEFEYQLKKDYELARIAAEKDKDVTVEQIRLEGKRIDATGRVEAAEVQAEGRDISNKRDNLVELELSETPKNKEIVNEVIPDLKSTIQPQTAFGNEIKLQKFNFLLPETENEVETESITKNPNETEEVETTQEMVELPMEEED
jgi:hypothetical protein